MDCRGRFRPFDLPELVDQDSGDGRRSGRDVLGFVGLMAAMFYGRWTRGPVDKWNKVFKTKMSRHKTLDQRNKGCGVQKAIPTPTNFRDVDHRILAL